LQDPSGFWQPNANPRVPEAITAAGPRARATDSKLTERIGKNDSVDVVKKISETTSTHQKLTHGVSLNERTFGRNNKKHEKEEGEKKKKDKRVKNSIMETSDREEKTQTAGC
jgi:hypothetical protein